MLARAKTMPPRARVDLTSPPFPTRAWKFVRKGGIWSKKERAKPAGFYSKALQLALASRLINQSRTATADKMAVYLFGCQLERLEAEPGVRPQL